MSRIYASIGFLFVLVILTNIPTWFDSPAQNERQDDQTSGLPNYQATRMLSTIYDKQGQVNHRVFAKHMEHYENFDITLFEDPQYTVYTADKSSPWNVTAQKGVLYGDRQIHLNTNVTVQSLSEEDFVQRITSDFMEIDLNSKTVKSDQHVTISGRNYTTKSEGFFADLTSKQFEQLKKVQAIYDPNTQP